MYQTILVPLDGSKRAERILPHVEALAQSLAASVIFLKVVVPEFTIPGARGPDALQNIERIEAQVREFQAYLDTLEGEFREKGIKAKAVVEVGRVVKTIIDVCERESADLIAIASHGRSGLSEVFYGSIAAGILHRADRPLLLIRASGDS